LPRIQVNNSIVDYLEAGIGVPVIFIPGITEFKEAFSFQILGLKDSYRPISYDLRRGLKRSSDYTLDLLASDLLMFMRAIGIESAVICGHSFGGLVAMKFAQEHPEKTKALILVSSFPALPDMPSDRFLSWISSAVHPMHKSIGARFRFQFAKLLGKRSSSALAIEHRMTAVKTIARQAALTPQITIYQRMRIAQRADFRPVLPQIVSPTLIVAGERDRSFFLASAQEMYEAMPDAKLEVIEDAGHFCFLTRHDQFNAAVDEFLSDRLAEIG
jgi:pimeloyl-ACP methyl ester carboxylesterase